MPNNRSLQESGAGAVITDSRREIKGVGTGEEKINSSDGKNSAPLGDPSYRKDLYRGRCANALPDGGASMATRTRGRSARGSLIGEKYSDNFSGIRGWAHGFGGGRAFAQGLGGRSAVVITPDYLLVCSTADGEAITPGDYLKRGSAPRSPGGGAKRERRLTQGGHKGDTQLSSPESRSGSTPGGGARGRNQTNYTRIVQPARDTRSS